MTAYYNEIDPFIAAWLRRLIAEGLLGAGEVDTRSIEDVQPSDLKGFTQCHFFAGIGGWPFALDLAGWRDNRPVWTGSCPCQPLSGAGKQLGHADERHLWPAFHRLIAECGPPIVFGEQVASKDGREWFAGVRADLEALGYACGGADLCAAGIGAPHIRQRLYWVAHRDQEGRGDIVAGTARPECDWRGAVDLGCGPGEWLGEREPIRFEDGSARRTKSGVDLLVDGFPGRVATVGGFGNAILPQLGAHFIQAAEEAVAAT